MFINIDNEKLSDTLQDFYNATGINIAILPANYSDMVNPRYHIPNPYCNLIQSSPEGKKKCDLSEKCLIKQASVTGKPEVHICHAGLTDMVIPIIHDNILLGYVLFGQMRENTDFLQIKNMIKDLDIDIHKSEIFYNQIPFFDSQKIHSVENIVVMLVKYILLENMINANFEKYIKSVTDYINDNIEKNLSIQTISKNTGLSKSSLYKKFHKYYNCTVSEYINKKRVENSKELLIKTDLSIEIIAQQVGFNSTQYYSKTFKEIVGISPNKYRKSKNKET